MPEQAKATPESNAPMNVEARVAQYLQLRDKIDAMKKAHAEQLKPYNEAKRLMEGMFLAYLSETKQTSARTEAGTAHILDKISATVEDMDSFRKFIVENQQWHLVDWRANAPKVEEWSETRAGALPPGVKFSRFRTASVRRSD